MNGPVKGNIQCCANNFLLFSVQGTMEESFIFAIEEVNDSNWAFNSIVKCEFQKKDVVKKINAIPIHNNLGQLAFFARCMISLYSREGIMQGLSTGRRCTDLSDPKFEGLHKIIEYPDRRKPLLHLMYP